MSKTSELTICHAIEQNLHLPLESYSPWSPYIINNKLSHEIKYAIIAFAFYTPSVVKTYK